MKINFKHIVHDVVVVGGLVESAGSIVGTLGVNLPAADVAIVTAAAAGAGFVVAIGEDYLNNANPTTSVGQFLKWLVGLISHHPVPAPTPTPTPVVTGGGVTTGGNTVGDPGEHPDPPVGG